MRKTMKFCKTLGIFFIAALTAAMPFSAHAEEGGQGVVEEPAYGVSDDGKWVYNDYGDGTVSVGCTDETLVNAVIPETINGKTVTMIEVDCFKINAAVLESVVIPDTITHIEDWSFYNCTALKSIEFPDSLTDIAWQAFYGCSSLTEVYIPPSVVNIEEFVFEGCSSLKAVEVDEKNPNYVDIDGVLFDKAKTTLMYYPGAKEGATFDLPDTCTKIEDWAFIGNPYLEEIDLSNITELGEEIFYHCTALKHIEIPEGITSIEGAMFGNCTSLEKVTLPSTLDSIDDYAFYNCLALPEITIPGRVDTIGSYAFYNCPKLSSITIYHAVKEIGDYALGFYLDADTQKPERLPDFIVETEKDTAAHQYCSVNGIKSTAGVTQSSVFIVVLIVIVALVIIATIAIIIVQHRIKKRYELR